MLKTNGLNDDGTIDLFSDQANRDPYPLYATMREQCPVAFSENIGMWWVTSHEDAASVVSDHEQFKNKYPSGLKSKFGPEASEIMARRIDTPATLTTADAPEHPNNRRPIQKSLSKKRIRSLEPRLEEIARELMSKFSTTGQVDIVKAFTGPFPLYVVGEFLGIPRSDFGYFEELASALDRKSSVGSGENLDTAEQVKLAEELLRGDEYLLGLMRARRDAPRDDFFTELVNMVRPDGTKFSEPELLDIAQMLAQGGHETSSNAMGVMMLALATHPEIQEALRQNPDDLDAFVEESIRYATPVQFRTRRAEMDTEIRGCPVSAGQIVATSFASANRDPKVFPNPNAFDPSRPNLDEHLAFGRGAHHCLGSEIARAEMRIALRLALELMGNIQLVEPGDSAFYWNRHPLLRGLGSLQIKFVPLSSGAGPEAEEGVLGAADAQNPASEDQLQLKVRSRVESAQDVLTLELESVDGSALPAWSPGAHIDVTMPNSLCRQYSLCGNPADRGRYRISVLREPKSRGGSQWMHDNADMGTELAITGPRNHFKLERAKTYRFVAGGIGITPILAMIREVNDSGAEWTLLYGGRTRKSMAFLDELSVYGDRVTVSPQDEFGLLDFASWFAEPTEETLIYACGPEPMLQAAEKTTAHWPSGALHLERFAVAANADLSRDSEFEITVASRDLTLKVGRGQSIVEVLRAAGIKITTNCGEGTCGTCETEVLEGIPDHRDSVLTAAERASNESLCPCVSRACSSKLVLDL